MPRPSLQDEMTQHIASLRRYALALARNRAEAEDLVQECLTRAIASADTYQDGRDLRVWLFRILHNTYVSACRQSEVRTRAHRDLDAEQATEPTQGQMIEVREVMAAMARLPEDQRRALTLVAVEELRYEEAARRLGIPVGTFMSRLGRGREALRALLRGERKPKFKVVGALT